jgi:hypothetical protein
MNKVNRNMSPQRRNVATLNQLAADKYIMGGKAAVKKRAASGSPKKVKTASKPAPKKPATKKPASRAAPAKRAASKSPRRAQRSSSKPRRKTAVKLL